MKVESRSAPHIHYHESAAVIMGDVLLPILAVYAMCFYYYGLRAAVLALVSAAAAAVSDAACLFISGKRVNLMDLSAVVTGLMIPLMMPASIPFRIVIAASVFAIVVAKHPFGGMGNNIFNPAAAGVAFAAVCYPVRMFSYPRPSPFEHLPIFPDETLTLTNSPAFTLQLGGVPNYEFIDMSLGNFPGPMGATNILVILACLLYLILRGAVRWELPAAYLAVLGALFYLFPRGGMTNLHAFYYEIMSGSVLFGGVFMLTDPVTSPKRSWARAAYGILAAALVFLFRRLGMIEEVFVYVLLIMNSSAWAFDLLGERTARLIRRRSIEHIDDKKIQKKQ